MKSKTIIKVRKARIENISSLPTVPGNLKRISNIIEKPGLTLDEIGRFVASDPALASKVLKMVNSAMYGFPGRITAVSYAVMLLGLNVVKGLLLGIAVFDIMEQTMRGLWAHSVGCAVASRCIAEKKGIKDPEEFSIAGLLHDIGKAILVLEYRTEYEKAMEGAAEGKIPIFEAEKEVFSDGHAEVAMWLAEKWRFPRNLVEVIAYHHRPSLSQIAPMETAIIHVADIIVRARGIGFAGDFYVPDLNTQAFDLLGLFDVDIKEILLKIDDATDAIYDSTE
ncbi:MAG: HDOD domain-containing protein [Syntrophales bacterium]|jgi:putative nucleotidyltransferase with HDIG domain